MVKAQPKKMEINLNQHHALLDMRDALNKYAEEVNVEVSKKESFHRERCKVISHDHDDKDGNKSLYVCIVMKKDNTHLISIPMLDIYRHSEWFWR